MNIHAQQAIVRGECPAGDHKHHNRLVSCKGCGETVCSSCWFGENGYCEDCVRSDVYQLIKEKENEYVP